MIETLRSFINMIFQPPITFLDLATENLRNVNMVTARGIDLSNYTRIFNDMPTEWQIALQSLFISVVVIGTLLLFRLSVRTYFAIKAGVKWW